MRGIPHPKFQNLNVSLNADIFWYNWMFSSLCTGGIALGILDKYAPVEGSAIGVLGVMILHGISYFLIFINTPDNAVWEPTMDIAYIPPK